MHGKMPYQRKWSKEQEKAVVDAQLHYGMTSKQATKAANEGQLPGIGTGLDAFAIPLATVREYTTRARQEQAAKQRTAASPAKVLEDAVGEMGQMLAMAVDKAKRRQRRGDNVALELGQIARSAQELVKLAKAIRDVDGKRVDLRPESTDRKSVV